MELLCNHATGSEERAAVEELMAFVCIGFWAGLRVEEVTLNSLKGMIQFWEETMNDKDDPFSWSLYMGGSRERQGFVGIASPSATRIEVGFHFESGLVG